MGGVKALAFAYRNWAKAALKEVVRDTGNHILIKQESEDATVALCEYYQPKVIFFYGWSWMIPDEIVNRWLCIGLHPSHLPAYRGGSPLQHQIINGEGLGAVTFFRLTPEMDAGPICAQVPCGLGGSLDSIFKRIQKIAVSETAGFLDTLALGKELSFREQRQGDGLVWRRRKPGESEITSEELASSSARQIRDKIRALRSETENYPTAFVRCKDGERLYLTGSYLGDSLP